MVSVVCLGVSLAEAEDAKNKEKRRFGFGAEYSLESGRIEITREQAEELQQFVPNCAAETPPGVQPVAQLKFKGKPFFPVGIYGDRGFMPLLPTSFEEFKANGINCLLTRDVCNRTPPSDKARARYSAAREYNIKQTLAEANALDIAIIANLGTEWGGLIKEGKGWTKKNEEMIRYNVERLRDNPAIWAFYLMDEPDLDDRLIFKFGLEDELPTIPDWYTPARAKVYQREVRWYYDVVKKYAPNHPLMECYTRMDAIGMDGYDIHDSAAYPVHDNPAYPNNKLYQATQRAQTSALACKYYGGGKKSFIFSPQSYDRDHDIIGKGTILETRYVSFAPLTQGAQGIVYWCLWWSSREMLETRIFPITRELNRAGPYMLGEWKNELVTSSHDGTTWAVLKDFPVRDPLLVGKMKPLPDVSHCLRKKGDEYFLLAVNNTKFPKTVTFNLKKIPGLQETQELRDFFSGLDVTVKDKKLTVEYVPYGVHAFIIPTTETARVKLARTAWKLRFEDKFKGGKISEKWSAPGQPATVKAGAASAQYLWSDTPGFLCLNEKFPGDVHVEYTLRIPNNKNNLYRPHGFWMSSKTGKFNSGYHFSLGRKGDETSVLLRNGIKLARKHWDSKTPVIIPGKKQHLVFTRIGKQLTCTVDGLQVFDIEDPTPVDGGGMGFTILHDQYIDNVKVYTR